MPARFFVEGTRAAGDAVPLDAADARKVATVLRLRTGDEIEAIDSASQRFRATLRFEGDAVVARLDEALPSSAAGRLRVTVAQAIPKGQKMDFVVEKLVELGAAAILPLRSSRCVADASPAKLERWRRLARTAAMQCGRAEVPAIEDPLDIEALAVRCAASDLALVPWEAADPVPLREALPPLLEGAREVLFAIGPEGGFAPDEVARLEAAGARPVSLGRRILRTETAAMAMLAILEYASDGL